MDPRWVQALRRDHPDAAVRVEQEGVCIRYSALARPELGSALVCGAGEGAQPEGDVQVTHRAQHAGVAPVRGPALPRAGPSVFLVVVILAIVAVFLLR